MSVTDPLIKDIKVHTLHLFDVHQVPDSHPALLDFCQTLEAIFAKGLLRHQQGPFSAAKPAEAHSWMASLAVDDPEEKGFAYGRAVDAAGGCRGVRTPEGRFRLLVRHCLAKRCLHVPLQALMSSRKMSALYGPNSILGDEILLEILLSVLLQCAKIDFQLDLDNYAFLDTTWSIPDVVKLEIVPCTSLGISVSFSDNKAVIVHIQPNSVASEFSEISKGDILSSLNGIEINSSCKGRLNTILRINKGRPITLTIIKAFHKQSKDIFPPIRKILSNLQIDLQPIRDVQTQNETQSSNNSKIASNKSTKAGFRATYLGTVDVGNNGSVKQIEEAMRKCLAVSKMCTEEPVIVEIGELSVKIFNAEANEMIFKHSYMQISSCGSAHNQPNYIAYIAGDENCDTASKFTCFIFYVKDTEDAYTILQSIGQGFYRTHFAV